uniref:Cytochrome c oxidase assembly protein COX16 homolog, mitochondrial n=1 Tax=Castor canadensis TaxID=51338 RepID=A0A8C0WW01_CASCN
KLLPAIYKTHLRSNDSLEEGGGKLLIVGGSFGLREFSQIHYDAVKVKLDPELEKKLKMNKIPLESEILVLYYLCLLHL